MSRIPRELRTLFNRSLWLYLAVILVFAWSVNGAQAVKERGHYLVGIFYNEDLKNYKDGVVYFDYLTRHRPDARNYFLLGYCYAQMDDNRRAAKYFEEAVRRAPDDKMYPPYLDVAKARIADPHANVSFPADQIVIPVE